ncbi:MAG TPA: NAD-dependent dehydratase [Streptomyces sp.]|nr:NAD-dependent dehydratase [Streptomyces sp.]
MNAPTPPAPSSRSGGADVLVAGGTGFIGGAIVRALLDRTGATAPRIGVLCRRPPPPGSRAARVRYVRGDLADPRTLDGTCAGVTTVVHAASYVGGDARTCRRVNHLGSLALLDEARRAGVRRLLYVSTASVYGPGPHRGLTEDQAEPAPRSAASASRLRAEHAVRRAGGVVLRPHLVYGPGDRWFVPALALLARRVPTWPRGPSALGSVVHVDDLARAVSALAVPDGPSGTDGVYHVAHPRPEAMREVVATICRELGTPPPDGAVPVEEFRSLTARALPGLSAHQVDLIVQDHWYDTSRVWRDAAVTPGAGFRERFTDCSNWYRDHLSGLPARG